MSLRVAMIQADFPVGDIVGNSRRIADYIVEARDRCQADVVLFPELTVSGYPPEDLLLRPQFLSACAASLKQIARDVCGIVAVVGWPESAGPVVYNAMSVLRARCHRVRWRVLARRCQWPCSLGSHCLRGTCAGRGFRSCRQCLHPCELADRHRHRSRRRDLARDCAGCVTTAERTASTRSGSACRAGWIRQSCWPWPWMHWDPITSLRCTCRPASPRR